MGIINATPDSFSDAGDHPDLDARVAELLEAGADIIDVGGETASGHHPAVTAEEEIARVVPLIERIAARGATVSVDTYKPAVAETAIVPLQDVLALGSEARMNTPGRAGGNWSWRYTPDILSPTVLERLRVLTALYGRAPKQEPEAEGQEPGAGEGVSG